MSEMFKMGLGFRECPVAQETSSSASCMLISSNMLSKYISDSTLVLNGKSATRSSSTFGISDVIAAQVPK